MAPVHLEINLALCDSSNSESWVGIKPWPRYSQDHKHDNCNNKALFSISFGNFVCVWEGGRFTYAACTVAYMKKFKISFTQLSNGLHLLSRCLSTIQFQGLGCNDKRYGWAKLEIANGNRNCLQAALASLKGQFSHYSVWWELKWTFSKID